MKSLICPSCSEIIIIENSDLSVLHSISKIIKCEFCGNDLAIKIKKYIADEDQYEDFDEFAERSDLNSGCPGDCHECNECVF